MGVDIGDLAVKNPTSLENLSGRIIAVDAFNTLYQFLASIRQEDGTPLMDFKGRVTAHLSGLFYRTTKLVNNGVKPVFVFDGKAPRFKGKTQEARAAAKKTAEEKWIKALEEKKYDEARKYAQATSRLTSEMVDDCKLLLDGIGVPWIQAPSEAEAQAAVMVQKGIAYASSSQDYDSLLFGCPVLIRNINITGRRKVPRQDRYITVEPEEINLNETLKSIGIKREKLIIMGILTGTDFNEGVFRVGPKTALKIVKEIKNFNDAKKYVKEKYDYDFEGYIDEVYEFFLKPPYEGVKKKFKWGNIQSEKVTKLLCDEHDFSEERIGRTLKDLEKSFKERGAQRNLEGWF